MKTREDFVSNSSSSSFICLLDDNQYGILLEDFQVLSLKEYMKEFGFRELFEYFSYEKTEPKFVQPQAYSRMFKSHNCNVFPLNAKEAYEDYMKLKTSERHDLKYGSDEYIKQCEALDKLQARVISKCIEALELEWGDKVFCYQEVDDNEVLNDQLNATSMEDLVQQKWDYVNSLKPLRFRREFSNH